MSVLLLLIVIGGCSLLPSPRNLLKSVPAPTVAISTETKKAIQAVIQRANDEQVNALTTNDPTVMQDTATAGYYEELVQVNQGLVAGGVTAIKLIAFEWGPIDPQVDGSVQATTFESWQTTFSDSHTEVQDRERNVYTMVQQGGAWTVDADGHPDSQLIQPGTTPTVATGRGSSPLPTPAAIGPGTGSQLGQSSNWSGYAATGGTFTSVTGTWTVPKVTAAAKVTSTRRGANIFGDATWVGIGGVASHDLIQAGTEATVVSPGNITYDAWVEMLPAGSKTVPLTVSPGDSITISLTAGDAGSWSVTYRNNTSGKTYDVTENYTSSESSAEWIEEAPSGGRRLVPLDNFGEVQFTGGSAIKDGEVVTVSSSGARAVTMIDQNDQPLAVPSAVGKDGGSFTVSRSP